MKLSLLFCASIQCVWIWYVWIHSVSCFSLCQWIPPIEILCSFEQWIAIIHINFCIFYECSGHCCFILWFSCNDRSCFHDFIEKIKVKAWRLCDPHIVLCITQRHNYYPINMTNARSRRKIWWSKQTSTNLCHYCSEDQAEV